MDNTFSDIFNELQIKCNNLRFPWFFLHLFPVQTVPLCWKTRTESWLVSPNSSLMLLRTHFQGTPLTLASRSRQFSWWSVHFAIFSLMHFLLMAFNLMIFSHFPPAFSFFAMMVLNIPQLLVLFDICATYFSMVLTEYLLYEFPR